MGKDVVGTRYNVVGMRLLCCENEILGRGNELNIIFHMSPQCCRTFLYILGLFLKDKIQNWNIFGGLKISNIFFFFGMLIFLIFWGVNSRFWGEACA